MRFFLRNVLSFLQRLSMLKRSFAKIAEEDWKMEVLIQFLEFKKQR